IRQPAPFGDGAKPMLVITQHVLRIDREHSIGRSIASDPFEGPQPVICWRGTRPFNMRTRGKQLTLRKPHSSKERHKLEQPTPGVLFQKMCAEKTSTQYQGSIDIELLGIRYYGFLIANLYNRSRPHMSLGPGIPDPSI